MKHIATKHPRGWRRRARSALGALVIAGSVLAVTAATASAERACNQPQEGGSNTCLTIAPTHTVRCPILVGIDIEMGYDEAQAILKYHRENGGVHLAFGTVIMADDPGYDTASLFPVPLRPGWPAVGDGVLSAEFYTAVSYRDMDEDADGSDEVYARIALHDPRYDSPRIFESGVIRDNYAGCITATDPGNPPN